MSETKKYFYLKLKDTFFDSEEIKILDSMKNGKDYQIFYLKLCLLSLKSEGALLFKNMLPYDVSMLATVTNTNIDTVKTAIEIFNKIGLVMITDTGVIYMTDIQTLIGKSSSEAERQKKYRNRIKQKNQKNITNDITNVTNLGKNVTNVTTNEQQVLNSSTPKIELYSKIDTDTDIRDIKKDNLKKYININKQYKQKENQNKEINNNNIYNNNNANSLDNSPSAKAGDRIDSLRLYWNSKKELPPMRINIFNFNAIDRQTCIAIVSCYSDDEIKNAIDNYYKILSDTDHYSVPYPYQSFIGFMNKGVEKFFKDAKPFERYIKQNPDINIKFQQDCAKYEAQAQELQRKAGYKK